MKKHLFYLLSALFLLGCAEQPGITEPLAMVNVVQASSEARTRSLESAVYNEAMDTWMIPQPDPYSLANFQKAYDNLAAKKSLQSLTRSQEAEFASAKKLDPTHYALRIYPRNEEEQWLVETMDDVKVVYLPFDYSQLTQEEVEVLPRQVRTRTADNTFTEKSPYTVTYENYEVTDGGPTGPVTFQLPILYAVWPADKPLPEELEYVVDYEVFLPNSAIDRQSVGALLLLEREAVSAALGIDIDPTKPINPPPVLEGFVKVYDNQLQKLVPMKYMPISCQFGTNILEGSTTLVGFFMIELPTLPSGLIYSDIIPTTLAFTYRDPHNRWKITTESSTAPYIVSQPVTFELAADGWRYGCTNITLSSSNRQENEIQRAATYFYNDQSDFPKHYPSGGFKIIANNGPSSTPGLKGSFGTPSCIINIYNEGDSNPVVIGSTLHEIGHIVHYSNNSKNYTDIPDLLRESFAEYSGWYFGEGYYYSQGWVMPSYFLDITSCANQLWWKTCPGKSAWYSPLFIDLTDNLNQMTYFAPGFPNDNIRNVPASVIWNIITTSTNWAQCRSKLQSYVGIYYTTTEFNDWIIDFDHWFANN